MRVCGDSRAGMTNGGFGVIVCWSAIYLEDWRCAAGEDWVGIIYINKRIKSRTRD